MASQILDGYLSLDDDARLNVLLRLDTAFAPDTESLSAAARSYADSPNDKTYRALAKAIDAPRQKLFRRLNMAPSGTHCNRRDAPADTVAAARIPQDHPV